MSKVKEFKEAVSEMRGTMPFRGRMKDRKDSVIMMPSMRKVKRSRGKSHLGMKPQTIVTDWVFVGSPNAVRRGLYPIVKAVKRIWHDSSAFA